MRAPNALRVVIRDRSPACFSFRAAMRFGYRRAVKKHAGACGDMPHLSRRGRRRPHAPRPCHRSRERGASMPKLSELIRGNDLVVAPVALNPIMARMAEEAGFKAVYLSGGSLGWYKCVTEANITLPEMAQVALDMRAACTLPIVLDAGGGWGDPMHVHRTIALAQAAGFAAIEIEDQ